MFSTNVMFIVIASKREVWLLFRCSIYIHADCTQCVCHIGVITSDTMTQRGQSYEGMNRGRISITLKYTTQMKQHIEINKSNTGLMQKLRTHCPIQFSARQKISILQPISAFLNHLCPNVCIEILRTGCRVSEKVSLAFRTLLKNTFFSKGRHTV